VHDVGCQCWDHLSDSPARETIIILRNTPVQDFYLMDGDIRHILYKIVMAILPQ
jgi:hypothetical protein